MGPSPTGQKLQEILSGGGKLGPLMGDQSKFAYPDMSDDKRAEGSREAFLNFNNFNQPGSLANRNNSANLSQGSLNLSQN